MSDNHPEKQVPAEISSTFQRLSLQESAPTLSTEQLRILELAKAAPPQSTIKVLWDILSQGSANESLVLDPGERLLTLELLGNLESKVASSKAPTPTPTPTLTPPPLPTHNPQTRLIPPSSTSRRLSARIGQFLKPPVSQPTRVKEVNPLVEEEPPNYDQALVGSNAEKIIQAKDNKDIKALPLDGTGNVFFDIAFGDQHTGRIEFKLYDDIVPLTARNFRELTRGHLGKGYLGSCFHRVIPYFMAQGGDYLKHDGTGQDSIYGEKFADENFIVKHTKPGLLSMANAGPNSNGCQFFITYVPCPWLDGKHVVFGEVVKGFDICKQMETEGSASGKPRRRVEITACGVLY